MFQRAEQHAAAGDWASARKAYAAVLDVDARHGAALLQLSYVESLTGHYRAARAYALRAYAAGIADEPLLQELIRRLRTFNEVEALRDCAARLPPLTTVGTPLLVEFAVQFSNLGEQEAALQFADAAVARPADNPAARMVHGQILTYLGRFDAAAVDFDHVLQRFPRLAPAWWSLSRLRKQTPQSNHVAQLRSLLALPGLRPLDVAAVGFALHKELDDLGDHAGAWEALQRACRAKRSTLEYTRADTHELFERLLALPTSSAQAVDIPALAVPSADVDPLPGSARTPIFIVGMHRSGTTLLEQFLDGHSEVKGVGELYDFTSAMRHATDHHCRGVIDAAIVERAIHADFAEVGARYLAGMEWRLGEERCFTDKLPSNFLNIGFICRALPQARILHMSRDPVETCFSNLRELFSDANPYSYDQAELADYYRQYRRLMAHWHHAFPGRILDVEYAELTRDPEAVLRRVTTFCGIDFEPAMLELQQRTRGVATASAVQVRAGVVVRDQPKWAPYEQQLQPLIRALRA